MDSSADAEIKKNIGTYIYIYIPYKRKKIELDVSLSYGIM